MRPIALNRKNSLFAGHDDGAINWACLASLIETAKLHGINPQAYRKRDFDPIDLRTSDLCDGVSSCGRVTPRMGMGVEGRAVEDQVNGLGGGKCSANHRSSPVAAIKVC